MQLNNGRPFVPASLVDRLRLRRAALRYAAHGWAVMPGACLQGRRFACDRADCPIRGCHPAIESWEDDASADATRVAAWWRHRPYPVLLATGGKFDVLEVPAPVGLRALGAARLRAHLTPDPSALPCGQAQPLRPDHTHGRGPVAVGPTGRWMFFVRPGAALRAELDNCLDVVLHSRGSWVPAAPTRMPEGAVRWAVTPGSVHWQLPDSPAVQAVLVEALAALGRRPATGAGERPVSVPRQMSTSRRGMS